MASKNDCIELANKLIVELELCREPIGSIIEIDGEFMWLIIENVFKTDLLPKWRSLDCIDETDEYQFILMTLEQIFDLNLKINPAYLTLRKPEYVQLVLNSLYLTYQFINSKNGSSCVLSDRTSDQSSVSSSRKCSSDSSLVANSDRTDESSIDQSEVILSDQMKKNEKPELDEQKNKKKKMTDEEFEEQLKKLKETKKILNDDLTCMKEQTFATELSHKIMEILNIQEKTKEIRENLNKLEIYGPHLFEQPIKKNPISSAKKPSRTSKKVLVKKNSKKTSSTKGPLPKKTKPMNLNELLNKLTGLTSKQVHELKDRTDHQRELVNSIKVGLIEKERNLQGEMLSRVKRENQLLELLKRDMNSLESSKNSPERRDELKKAKSELRREGAQLRKQLDEYYLHNLSNYKHLESEQEKQLKELTKRDARLFREQLSEARKELREFETTKRESQKSLLDNYDNFYASQSMMIKQELLRKQNLNSRDFMQNSRSINRHLEQSFAYKLYPKFN